MATNPTLLSMPLAENGTKNVIPETQATAGDGLFSQSTGFPAETSLPLGAGGVAPSREDFNGMANLLGGIAFMAQKGFTFNYDATQDYYAGCVVTDGGNRYLCIADMAAGTVAPSADTTHDYWIFYPVGVINKRDVVTTSGTYTAPVTGWYRITVKGGGGGGSGAAYNGSAKSIAGSGGGEGGTTIAYEYMSVGQQASVVIGAGGAGGAGAANTSSVNTGATGGNSSVSVNSSTLVGYGGQGGSGAGGAGGAGTVPGAPGAAVKSYPGTLSIYGGAGGGAGGSQGGNENGTQAGTNGGGGGGGMRTSGGASGGSAGGDGFVWFEYFAEV